MDAALVGRDAVVERVWRALAAGTPVLLDGPSGIGKTALWRAVLDHARRTGWRVLSAAPTEAETALPYAALADVLRPLADALPGLPAPQRAAADMVLLTGEHDGAAVDERAVGAATRTLLDTAVTDAPRLLLAVDDPQWLDPPSARALRFALRRLSRWPAVLATHRTGENPPAPVPLGLDDDPTGRHPLLRADVPPLPAPDLHRILQARLGGTLSRPLVERLARDADGNPLLAVELARAVLRLPRPPAHDEDLPVPSSLRRLLAETLRTLPGPSREAVRLAALLTVPDMRDLTAAGVPPGALDAAEDAGLVVVTPSRISFAHPRYAAAVRESIPPGARRRLHAVLARAVADPDERARQLARCAVAPDADVAADLAAAAARQRMRGAAALAADWYARAAELTPPAATADRNRRRLDAVQCRIDSGDYAAAGRAAEAAAAELAGAERGEALLLRALVAWCADDLVTAVRVAEQALAAAGGDGHLAGRIHTHLTMFHDQPEAARAHARAAIARLSDRDDHRPLLTAALLLLFFHEVRAGGEAPTGLLDRALALEAGEPSYLAGSVPAIWWKAVDDHDRARARLHLMLDRAVARGDDPLRHEALTHLGETELLAGRFAEAGTHIAAARDLGEQLGTGLVGESWLAGMLDAHRGRLARAGAAAAGLRRDDDRGDTWSRRLHRQLAGLVALASGEWATAAAAYGSLAADLDGSGIAEPLGQRFEPDWIEACVGAGDLDTAHAALDRLARRHGRLPRPWTTLGLARSRVLLAGATGADPGEALDALAQARAAVPEAVLPLDRARCLLAAGQAYRRVRRRREARAALDAAVAEFDALGASAFADRARAELGRIGARTPAPTTLTATEERVARLAARGQTNRLIADALYISPKTVEANLARVYRKLGIASRAELGAAMGRPPGQ
ncbi:DNA-binding CsgD family transcriptional regulator [Micromonospora echinospora]|uniref:DNA-binding CsgD family transcriptional regulator n=1 Tax=Micromonospora echinospora TaxID=1877 RepID=A0ABR6MIN2_MICEC|nr:LuxR family transcriptional regulator [Micromonospora echinospora]MBB5114202.1 DNA-binding CsgD family transcriptional regulator [Micromonospora echinospora]